MRRGDLQRALEAVRADHKLIEGHSCVALRRADGRWVCGLAYRNRYDAQAQALRRARKGGFSGGYLVHREEGRVEIYEAFRYEPTVARWVKTALDEPLQVKGLKAPLAAPLGARTRLSALSLDGLERLAAC